MNLLETPVQLSEKVSYLHEKIDIVYQQVQRSSESPSRIDFA